MSMESQLSRTSLYTFVVKFVLTFITHENISRARNTDRGQAALTFVLKNKYPCPFVY